MIKFETHQKPISVKIIDFGLSYISSNIEDKAVDIHVFEKTLQCVVSRDEIMKKCMQSFMEGYKVNAD